MPHWLRRFVKWIFEVVKTTHISADIGNLDVRWEEALDAVDGLVVQELDEAAGQGGLQLLLLGLGLLVVLDAVNGILQLEVEQGEPLSTKLDSPQQLVLPAFHVSKPHLEPRVHDQAGHVAVCFDRMGEEEKDGQGRQSDGRRQVRLVGFEEGNIDQELMLAARWVLAGKTCNTKLMNDKYLGLKSRGLKYV